MSVSRTTKWVALALAFASVSSLSEPVTADEAGEALDNGDFYENRADGWFWYIDPPPPIEEEEQELPPMMPGAPGSAEAGPAPLSAEWLRQNLPVLRDEAIDNPTNDNVRAYFYAQRIMFDKAQIFSDRAQYVVENDPLLDEDLRLPFASAAKVAVLSSANKTKWSIVDGLAEKVGIWVFYDAECPHCENQILPINRLADQNNLKIEVIHKQGGVIAGLDPRIKLRKDNGQFRNLNVNFTPTVMMLMPPDNYYVITQGFASYSELVDKLVGAAHEYGLISREEFYAASPTSRGILDASVVSDMDKVDWNNTDEWVPFLQGEISKTYGIGTYEEDGE